MYNFMINPNVRDGRMLDMWSANCPLKNKNFLWLCFRGQIQSASALVGRKWRGSASCVSCGVVEHTDHILFNCLVARYCWCIIRDCFQVDSVPRSREEFNELFLSTSGKGKNAVVWFWFAALVWALWLTRNDRIFNKKVLMNPCVPLYKSLSLMQQWFPLVAVKRRQATEGIIAKLAQMLRECNAPSTRAGVG